MYFYVCVCTLIKPLQSLILSQSGIYSNNVRNTQISLNSKIKPSNSLSAKAESLPTSLKQSVELVSKKGTTRFLTTLPWQEHRFSLHKTAFNDVVVLRYVWYPTTLPQHCSCGARFSIEY